MGWFVLSEPSLKIMTPYTIEEVFPTKDNVAWVTIIRLHYATLPEDVIVLPDLGSWFIAYHNSKAVAYAGMTTIKPKIGYMVRSGVLAAHRGHGLQRDLIFARIGKAIELKYNELYTFTVVDNIQSSNNIINSGFRLFTPRDKWGGDGVNYWKLNLKDTQNG